MVIAEDNSIKPITLGLNWDGTNKKVLTKTVYHWELKGMGRL